MTTNSINNSSSSIQISDINIAGSTISTTTTNTDLNLIPDGAGKVVISGSYSLPSDPGEAGQILNTSGSGQLSFGLNYTFNVQTFTASGTYTPSPGLVNAVIEVVGGGGGGGGCSAATSSLIACGGGGGGGGYAQKSVNAATIGASQIISIGAGGIAGTPSVNGGTGGTTSFGSIVSATGGSGGVSATAAATIIQTQGGNSGIGVSGDVNIVGGGGRDGIGHLFTTGFFCVGGSGGSSYYGATKCNTGTGGTGLDGKIGNFYGGGATGAYNYASGSSIARNGGAGASGLVVITEFIE